MSTLRICLQNPQRPCTISGWQNATLVIYVDGVEVYRGNMAARIEDTLELWRRELDYLETYWRR